MLFDDPEKYITGEIEGLLMAFGSSPDMPFSPIYGDAVEIPINSNFGFAVFEAIISKKETRYPTNKNIPCSIAISLSEPEKECCSPA